MDNAEQLHALLLTKEESTVASFHAVCRELGIEACTPTTDDIGRHLDDEKYAAVVVDFDDPDAGEKFFPVLQQSRLNKNSVVVAVAANARNLDRALHCRAHFVLKRPVQDIEVRRSLRAAYDFMLSDRRRQFRCSIVLPVRVRMLRTGATFECSTVNVSCNGLALYGSSQMKPAEMVDLEVVLPDSFVVAATGIVVWDDSRGKCGISFQCRTPEVRKKLDSWLTAQEKSLAKGELSCREFSQILPRSNAS